VGVKENIVALDSCSVPCVDPDRVAVARQRLLDAGDAQGLAGVFRLLGDPSRVRILYALLEAGELCVCDLSATVGSPESSVSQALRLLRTAGIVTNRRAGRNVYYRLADAHVRLLLDVSAEHLRHQAP
jgi:DNA-binding transcriptional ArsR family regulator